MEGESCSNTSILVTPYSYEDEDKKDNEALNARTTSNLPLRVASIQSRSTAQLTADMMKLQRVEPVPNLGLIAKNVPLCTSGRV